MKPGFAGAAAGVRLGEKISLLDWAAKWVRLVDGKAPYFDPDQAPWTREPAARLIDHETREICMTWATGSGKSTLFEAWLCWLVAVDPHSLQCSLQSDTAARRWVEKRVIPTLQQCEPAAPIMAGLHRHKLRKLEVIFPGHTFYFGTASPGQLQDVSVSRVLGIENHVWKEGMIVEAKARGHDRWNEKHVFASQPGHVGTDWHAEVLDCEHMDYLFRCPHCRRYAPWLGDEEDPRSAFEAAMAWDREETAKPTPDWGKVAESTALVTRCCGRRIPDDVYNRRALSLSGKYRSAGNGHVPGWIEYNVNALAMPHVAWATLVREYVLAKAEEIAGLSDRMRGFVGKRLARWWQERSLTPEIDTSRNRYSKGDYWPAPGEAPPMWEDEAFRFLTADPGIDHYWVVARAWKINGDSLLLYEGRLESIELLRDLQLRLRIPNSCVGLDVGFEPAKRAKHRLRYREPIKSGPKTSYSYWYLFKGDPGKGYPHEPGGPRHAWSFYENQISTEGVAYQYVKHSNLMIKDALAGLINDPDRYYGVFHDHSRDYERHMKAEHKVEYKPGEWRWDTTTKGAPNHLWDGECLQVVLACLKGLMRVEAPAE